VLVRVGLVGLALIVLAFIVAVVRCGCIRRGGAMVVVRRGVVMLASLATSSSGMLLWLLSPLVQL
jgi:hypothetical protein